MNRMKERYQKEIAPALMKDLNLENVMQIPRIQKVVVNIGMGEAMDNPKAHRCGCQRPDPDYRTKTGGDQSPQEHRQFQVARRHVDRRRK